MKNTITFLALLLAPFILNAQQVFDAVSVGPGYTNQVFYSMPNGEVFNVSNTNWDLAFQIAGYQASILVNGKSNVRLFKADLNVNAWSSITANDTIGKLNPSNELLNRDTSWWSGAFNNTADPSNQFDLGWGVYDFATHAVTGDSLYFIKLNSGVVKKIWIQVLQNGIYNFAYADVDGSNEVNASINKQDYQGKNFGYYSIVNNVALDREPNKYTWDLTFMQYMSSIPMVYKVTGALANDSVSTAKAYPVDPATVLSSGQSFDYHINNIGYTWKTFNLNTNAWSIEDSTVYFVYDRSGALWKLVFTGFGGSANGDIQFYKEPVTLQSVSENGGRPVLLAAYPNPASTQVQLTLFSDDYSKDGLVQVFDIDGKLILSQDLDQWSGLRNEVLDVSSLHTGIYMLSVSVNGVSKHQRLIIAR